MSCLLAQGFSRWENPCYCMSEYRFHRFFLAILKGGSLAILVSMVSACKKDKDNSLENLAFLYLVRNEARCEIQNPANGEPMVYTSVVLSSTDEKSIPFASRTEFDVILDYHGVALQTATFNGLQYRISREDLLQSVDIYETGECPIRSGVTPKLTEGAEYSISRYVDGSAVYTFTANVGAVIFHLVAPGTDATPDVNVQTL